jgi:AcrR family transcriptional regulator
MPRQRTVPDAALADAALAVVRDGGPAALTFGALAARVDLAASTLVQRFGTKSGLLRAALLHAWAQLEDATASAVASTTPDAAGVVDLLVELSGQYQPDDDFADQLLVLREDLRDPVLRERGRAWIATLVTVVEERLADAPGGAGGLGAVVVANWQGALTVWSFARDRPLPDAVRASLQALLGHLYRHHDEEGR